MRKYRQKAHFIQLKYRWLGIIVDFINLYKSNITILVTYSFWMKSKIIVSSIRLR